MIANEEREKKRVKLGREDTEGRKRREKGERRGKLDEGTGIWKEGWQARGKI